MIRISGLSKRYGATVALSALDLSVEDGESILVSGPNGSGKTTLLRAVAGLLRPTSGSVEIDGRDPREVRGRIGFIGHEPHLYPHLTVLENLRFFARLYGVNERACEEWIHRVGLSRKRDARAGSLSRGELQKAAIARALFHSPEILLADEPFTALDAEAASAVPEWMLREGRSTLLAAHDIERARPAIARVAKLKGGRLEAREPR